MNVRIASVNDGYALRRIVAFDIFRWNLRFGVAIAPRDRDEAEQRRRRQRLRQSIPSYLHEDLGLSPEHEMPKPNLLMWLLLIR